MKSRTNPRKQPGLNFSIIVLLVSFLLFSCFTQDCLVADVLGQDAAVDVVNTVEPEITVIFQEPVVITGATLKNVVSGRNFDVELVSEKNSMEFSYRPVKALNNGRHVFTVFARDLVGNSNSYTYEFDVYVPATEIQLRRPNSLGVANSTRFEVMISTTRPSVCKYTGIPVPSFDDVRLKLFDITGNLSEGTYTTDHVIYEYSAEPGFPRRFFVSCLDDLGRENFRDFTLYADITPPRIDKIYFDPSPVVEYPPEGRLYSVMNVIASEPVLCRYSPGLPGSDGSASSFGLMAPFEGYNQNEFEAYRALGSQRVIFLMIQ